MAKAIKTYTSAGGSFVCPAGVTAVTVQTSYDLSKFAPGVKQNNQGVLAISNTVLMIDDRMTVKSFGNTVSNATLVAALPAVTQVGTNSADGGNYAIANNNLYAWGSSGLPIGTATQPTIPTGVVGAQNFLKLFSTIHGVFAINEAGATYYCGTNPGLAGNSGTISTLSPNLIIGNHVFNSIATTGGTTTSPTSYAAVGIDAAGAAWSWGGNTRGQCGVGNITSPVATPTAVLGGKTWLNIQSGVGNANGTFNGTASGPTLCQFYGLANDNLLYGWGWDFFGSFGPAATIVSSPQVVLGGITGWTALFSRENTGVMFGIAGGTLYSWGAPAYLGNGSASSASFFATPVAISGVTSPVMAISGGSSTATSYSIAVNASGQAYAWGNNASGQLGLGDVAPRSVPTLIPGGITWAYIVTFPYANTTYNSVYGVATNGNVYSWGDNSAGQLGQGDVVSRSTPTLIPGILGRTSPQITSQVISVVPGTTYTITGQPVIKFGTIGITQGPIDSISVIYDQ